MDFREINYILAIAKHQNITKAADSLFISQPTLSKFLISVEDDLGLKLFRKVGHKYFLTYAGERYVEKARQILQLKNDLDAELSDIRKRDFGTLNIGFTTMRCSYMFPASLPYFHQKFPNVKINLTEGSSSDLDAALSEGTIEIAFYLQPLHFNPRLEYQKIMTEEMFLCTCKGHPLSQFSVKKAPDDPYPWLNPSHLKKERLLRLTSDQRTGQIIDDFFHRMSLSFADTFQIKSIPAITQLIASGYGVSFLFQSHLRQHADKSQIDCYRFDHAPILCDFVAATRKGSYLSDYSREYIEIIKRLYT